MKLYLETLFLVGVDASLGSRRFLYVPGVAPEDKFRSARFLTETPLTSVHRLSVIESIKARARKACSGLSERDFEEKLRQDAVVF